VGVRVRNTCFGIVFNTSPGRSEPGGGRANLAEARERSDLRGEIRGLGRRKASRALLQRAATAVLHGLIKIFMLTGLPFPFFLKRVQGRS